MYLPVKRALDVVVAAAALLVGLPVLAGVAVAVRYRMGTPVLFRQSRPGLRGNSFELIKFRTMTDARGPDGRLLPDRDRLTRLGALLRASSLDELPELFNVLKGEMSLVGPRPLLERYLPFFSPDERRRMDLRPGITGYAQIAGRNSLSWDDRLAMDVWYIDNCSLSLDLRILATTIIRVVRREGALADPRSAMLDLDEERR